MSEDLQRIELTIEEAKLKINKKIALDKLTSNKQFKEIFLEGYLKDEAIRLVHLKSDPNMQGEEQQKDIENQMISIGYFKQYCNTIVQMGRMAQNALEADESTREELLAEEV